MLSPFRFALLFLIAVALATPQVPLLGTVLGVEQAQAQQKKRKSLFDVLFKRRQKKRTERSSSNRRQNLRELPGVNINRRTTSNRKKRKPAAPPKPAVVVVKKEDAAKILVVGDFMAGGLASGLERLYAGNANFVIVNRTNPASGIVRDDVVDWPVRVAKLIEEEKPIAILSLIGMNDRQQMRLPNGRVEKLSDAWKTEYAKRVTSIAASGQAAKIPVIWVGLPPVNSNRMNTDYLAFNETFRSISESIGGSFVDVWDGFTNAEGKFVSAGPDINGQIVRLRGAKGIGMTRAGKAKLAFFADKELRRIGIVGNPDGFQYAALGTINPNFSQPGVPEYDPVGTGTTVVISLGSPSLDGGDTLEGEEDYLDAKEAKDSVSFDLVENG
ncbi:MAG: SGNH family hydrolase, partial [Pseudomonadota bacterium]